MRTVTLGEFLQHSQAYERTPVPIDPRLRRGLWLSLVAIGGAWACYRYLPNGETIRDSLFFLWKLRWAIALWDLVAKYRDELAVVCLLSVGFGILLLLITRACHVGEATFHWLIFGLVFVGFLNVVTVAILLTPILINFLTWLAIVVLLATVARSVVLAALTPRTRA